MEQLIEIFGPVTEEQNTNRIDEINRIKRKIIEYKTKYTDITEEATKNWFIIPFIQLLGYDITTDDVIPEYTSDIGTKKGEKVDYALQVYNRPIIFIECKSINTILTDKHINQLYRYYTTSNVKIAILTNGQTYKFFKDTQRENIMDLEPFLEIDIMKFTENDLYELFIYSKSHLELVNWKCR